MHFTRREHNDKQAMLNRRRLTCMEYFLEMRYCSKDSTDCTNVIIGLHGEEGEPIANNAQRGAYRQTQRPLATRGISPRLRALLLLLLLLLLSQPPWHCQVTPSGPLGTLAHVWHPSTSPHVSPLCPQANYQLLDSVCWTFLIRNTF